MDVPALRQDEGIFISCSALVFSNSDNSQDTDLTTLQRIVEEMRNQRDQRVYEKHKLKPGTSASTKQNPKLLRSKNEIDIAESLIKAREIVIAIGKGGPDRRPEAVEIWKKIDEKWKDIDAVLQSKLEDIYQRLTKQLRLVDNRDSAAGPSTSLKT
jgi:hypothetical protein